MTLTPKLEVQGLFFPLDDPYSAGHVCTEAEATSLNATRRENIRSAFSRQLKKTYPSGVVNAHDMEKLQAQFAEFAENYSFSRTWLTKPQDPVEASAYTIAKELAEAALKRGNIAKDSLQPGKFEEMIKNILVMKPEITEEAKIRVEAVRKAAERITL